MCGLAPVAGRIECVEARDRAGETLRVGGARPGGQIGDRRLFDDFAGLHHDDALRGLVVAAPVELVERRMEAAGVAVGTVIHQADVAQPRRVDHEAAARQHEQLAVGRRVAPLVVVLVAGVLLATAPPAGGKLVFAAVPARRRSLAMGIRQAAVPAGGLAAAAILPVVAGWTSWRVALFGAGVVSAVGAGGDAGAAALDLLAMFGGLAIGLLGLVYYEGRYLGKGVPGQEHAGSKLAMMIALGIGAHNLSEGLAIGQSYASGALGLAILLVVGFGAHNATEGFGILAPLSGASPRPSTSFVAKVLLIGGAPTFIGTILGSLFYSPVAYIMFLSLAGGALVYVVMMMYSSCRRQLGNGPLMAGIFIGISAGFLTDLIVMMGGV